MIGVFVGFLCIFLLRTLIFKGLTERRDYKSFGVKGLTPTHDSLYRTKGALPTRVHVKTKGSLIREHCVQNHMMSVVSGNSGWNSKQPWRAVDSWQSYCTRQQHMTVLGCNLKINMRRLTTGTRSEKRVVRRFCRCANVIECTYSNPR
jgi:hypothetical protein